MTLALALAALGAATALATWLIVAVALICVLADHLSHPDDDARDDGADLLGAGVSRHVAPRNTTNPEL